MDQALHAPRDWARARAEKDITRVEIGETPALPGGRRNNPPYSPFLEWESFALSTPDATFLSWTQRVSPFPPP